MPLAHHKGPSPSWTRTTTQVNGAPGRTGIRQGPRQAALKYAAPFVLTMFLPNHRSAWFAAMMVGPIKTLTDLRRIEAAVRVTCTECGFVRMLDREQLIHHCQFHRSSLDWEAVRSSLPCWNAKCLSRDTRVEALPFSQDRVVLRRKRADPRIGQGDGVCYQSAQSLRSARRADAGRHRRSADGCV